jgi:hypothetical protein
MTDPRSISDRLAAIGVTHAPGKRDSGQRILTTEGGAVLGSFDVFAAADLLTASDNAA